VQTWALVLSQKERKKEIVSVLLACETTRVLSVKSVSHSNYPDVKRGNRRSPTAGLCALCQSAAHLQEILSLLKIICLSYIGYGIIQPIVLRLLCIYEFINPSHELILTILDKTLVIS
jgi:hypothetical protein